jgi:hypothetical protein
MIDLVSDELAPTISSDYAMAACTAEPIYSWRITDATAISDE